MAEKRFDYVLNEFDEIEYITDIVDCEDRDFSDFLDFVNDLSKYTEKLERRNKQLHKDYKALKIQYDWLNDCSKELSIRNDRQAKRLKELYTLVEKEDWETLRGIIQELKEYEELLQKEWGYYGE